jgi:hypothetical protein
MTGLPGPRIRRRREGAPRVEDPGGDGLSIVELVLLACETSEDAFEVDDQVAARVRGGAARVLGREEDPFLRRSRGSIGAGGRPIDPGRTFD